MSTNTDPVSANSSSSEVQNWIFKTCKDVLASREKSALNQGVVIDKGDIKAANAVLANKEKLWQDCPTTIKYCFLSGANAGTEAQRSKVKSSIEEWTRYVNVSFVEETDPRQSDVRILFDPNDGSWSYVGLECRDIGEEEATMNLAWVQKSGSLTSNEKAVILHEFGHVLGLLHEHQSPAHGGVAVVNVQAALDMYRTGQHWPDDQIYEQVINVYKNVDVPNYSQVDELSIMHYPQPKELTGLDHDIGYNRSLSELDKAYMVVQYPRAEPHPEAPEWTFEHALSVIGCPDDVAQKLNKARADCTDPQGQINPSNDSHLAKSTKPRPSFADPSTAAAGTTTDAVEKEASWKSAAVEGPFIKLLYDRLLNFLPPGEGQYFALQFLTRYLDKESYAYDTSGVFSRFEKPVLVNEAEFRLTDALYNVGSIVGGPNGQSLSTNYIKILNSLIPAYEGVKARKERELMRSWLLTPTHKDEAAYTVDSRLIIPGLDPSDAKALSKQTGIQINGDDSNAKGPEDATTSSDSAQDVLKGVVDDGKTGARPMTRMEFSNQLTMEYLNHKRDWELTRDSKIRNAEDMNDPKEMERLTRELAHTTGVENAKLSAKYSDAVVRGHSHTVRELLGHLDVRTTAEMLQDAKDSLRESAVSSLFTASNVYPVQMQPADWFLALDTGFTREDLSQDPAMLEAAIKAKSMQIDSLETQIATLRSFQVGDAKALQAQVEEAATAQNKAMENLAGAYTENTISAVKLAISAVAAANPAVAAAGATYAAAKGLMDTSKLQEVLGPDSKNLDQIGQGIDAVTYAGQGVNAASRRLTELMSAASLAKAGETQTMVENTQRALTAAKKELQEMTENYTIAVQADLKRKASPPVEGQIPAGNGGSRWIDLSIRTEVQSGTTTSSSQSSASASSMSCNFWIGSYSSSSHTSSASNDSSQVSGKLQIAVSMRVTYVTVDRSGWFDPSLAQMSASFMHAYEGADYTSWSKYDHTDLDEKKSTAAQVAEEITQGRTGRIKDESYLSVFPIGYVLVKDCMIQVQSDELKDAQKKASFEKGCQSSGGFLCFSTSSSSSSSDDSSTAASIRTEDGMIIRIPGPQILGYMMQLMPEDKSKEFTEMPTDYLFEEMRRIDADDRDRNTPAPAHGVQDPATLFSSTQGKSKAVRGYSAGGMFREDTDAASSLEGSDKRASPLKAASINPGAGQDASPASGGKTIGNFAETFVKSVLDHSSMAGKTEQEKQDYLALIKDALSAAMSV